MLPAGDVCSIFTNAFGRLGRQIYQLLRIDAMDIAYAFIHATSATAFTGVALPPANTRVTHQPGEQIHRFEPCLVFRPDVDKNARGACASPPAFASLLAMNATRRAATRRSRYGITELRTSISPRHHRRRGRVQRRGAHYLPPANARVMLMHDKSVRACSGNA